MLKDLIGYVLLILKVIAISVGLTLYYTLIYPFVFLGRKIDEATKENKAGDQKKKS